MIRLAVVVIIVLLVAPAFAQPIKTPLDFVLSIHKRMYPSKYVKAPEEPPPAPRPKRGLKKAPPPVTETPQPETAPRVTPAPPRAKAKAKPRAAPRQARVQVAQRKPTAGECAQIGLGMNTVGRDGVIKGGRARKFTRAQVEQAIRDCGY